MKQAAQQNVIDWDEYVPEKEMESYKDDCKYCEDIVKKIIREDVKLGLKNAYSESP